jgi:hypothetical protein
MKKYVILTSSIFLVLIGILIEDRGLAMGVTAGGETFYPISSGSQDGACLKLGLYSFFITTIYSIISILRGHREIFLFVFYLVNSLIYAFFIILVMLDSSIVDAAKYGEWLPLIAHIIWTSSFVICCAWSLNKLIKQMGNI